MWYEKDFSGVESKDGKVQETGMILTPKEILLGYKTTMKYVSLLMYLSCLTLLGVRTFWFLH